MPDQSKKRWIEVLPEEERRVYEQSGFGRRLHLGKRPALIVVDVTISFTGSKPQPVEEAIKEFPTACGDAAWTAIPKIRRLLDVFRDKNLPVVFTRNHMNDQLFAGKSTKSTGPINREPRAYEFPEPLQPLPHEWILDKVRASAFFSTTLAPYLHKERVDSLVVCGVSTSGCVRATVVDAFSNGFDTLVVEDCCFDRSYFAHCANLFDMNAKYATVLTLDEIMESSLQEIV